jgi:hypothetical protein
MQQGLGVAARLFQSFEYQLSSRLVGRCQKSAGTCSTPDTSVRGVIKTGLKKLATKVASDTGDALLEYAKTLVA